MTTSNDGLLTKSISEVFLGIADGYYDLVCGLKGGFNYEIHYEEE